MGSRTAPRTAPHRDAWHYQHLSDGGTCWYLLHIPTGWRLTGGYGSSRAARRDVGDGGVYLELWLDAHRELLLPDRVTDRADSTHAQARTVLAWLDRHEPRAARVADLRVRARRLREHAARLRALVDDLDLQFGQVMREHPDMDAAARVVAGRIWALKTTHDSAATDLHIAAANLSHDAAALWREDQADRGRR